jgi:hypothetical protein
VSEDTCGTCGRPMTAGAWCGGCDKMPGSCKCERPDPVAAALGLDGDGPAPAPGASIGTKEHEKTKKVPPPEMPVAGPEIYTGILGEITMAAEPGTEADPVGILGSLLTMASVDIGRRPTSRSATTITRC